jgi:hypothetical protein
MFSIHKTFLTRRALVLTDVVMLLTTDEQYALPRDATSHTCTTCALCGSLVCRLQASNLHVEAIVAFQQAVYSPAWVQSTNN